MLDDNYLMLGPKVDLNKVDRIPTKKLASFTNFFIEQTVSFLNHFASTCETKLNKIEHKIQDIETLLIILESKIASVPGLTETHKNQTEPTVINQDLTANEKKDPVDIETTDDKSIESVCNKDNPLYKRYFGMLKVGIPLEAVRQKMAIENIDPSILERPNELQLVDN